ncbi:unnamed protein product, partial [Rotaria sp. Silwood1]
DVHLPTVQLSTDKLLIR